LCPANDHVFEREAKIKFKNRNLSLDSYIPTMPYIFLSIPEGVSVMTVIIDGVDAAPCGCGETIIIFPGALELPCGH
jgi:hypothetical protein